MPIVYFNEKEAVAAIAVIEDFIRNNPTTKTSLAVSKLPERINKCLVMQAKDAKGKKKPSDKSNG